MQNLKRHDLCEQPRLTYNAALQNVNVNMAAVSSAQANLSIAAKNVNRTTLISPLDGVISLLNVKKGERVVGNSDDGRYRNDACG